MTDVVPDPFDPERLRITEDDQLKLDRNVVEVDCPDCHALLRIVSSKRLPADVKLEWVEHR